MKAQIRHLLTPDIDPVGYVPEDPEHFMFLVQMLAGPEDGPGEESFQFTVCTPGWLQAQAQREGPVSGIHHVITNTYNWAAIESFFYRLIHRCTGATWHEVAAKLARFGHYEFEDYTLHHPPSHEPTALSTERVAEVEDIIGRVTRWAARRPDVVGLLLVGSYARNAARPDSDIDLVLLTTDQAGYADNTWAHELVLGDVIRVQSWGPITERRFRATSGLEVEIGIGSPDWAGTDPVDPGTRRVVTDGARSLHDPTGALDNLIHACRP